MKTLPQTFRAPRLVAALCLISTVALAQSSSSSSTQSASTPSTSQSGSTPSTSSSSSRNSTAMGASGTTSGDQLKWGDKRFVKKVAEGGQLEIAIAQLAADRATNADVKSFAQQLVNDHQEMSQKLEQLAQNKGLQSEIAEYSVRMSNSSDMASMNHSSGSTTASMNTNTNRSGSSNSSYGSTNTGSNRSGSTNSSYGSTNTGSNSAGTGTTGSSSSIANSSNSSTGSANSGAVANNTNPSRDRSGTVASSTSEYDRSTSGTNANRSTSASGTVGTSDTSRTDKDNDDWNDPTKNRHYKHLANKSGADFDKEFISMMISEHEDDIGMFTKESKKGDDAEVRSFAEASLPKLQEHLNRAQQISSTLKS